MSSQAPVEPQIQAVAVVQLIAIAALVLSTLIAATAVSIGLARAEFAPTAGTAAPNAIALSRADGAK